jgi:hypothetical protein
MADSDKDQELLRRKQASTRRALTFAGVRVLLTPSAVVGGPSRFACGKVTGYSDALAEPPPRPSAFSKRFC